MNNDVFTCKYTSGIESKAIQKLLVLSIMAADIRLGEENRDQDGRYRYDEKSRVLEIDTSSGYGKSLAHFFRLLITEMYVEGEYVLSSTSSSSAQRMRS